MNREIDNFVSAIIKSRVLVEERLIAIALLAGAESLTLEWPDTSSLGMPKWKRLLKLDGRRARARAMSLALTTAKKWRDELEGQ